MLLTLYMASINNLHPQNQVRPVEKVIVKILWRIVLTAIFLMYISIVIYRPALTPNMNLECICHDLVPFP